MGFQHHRQIIFMRDDMLFLEVIHKTSFIIEVFVFISTFKCWIIFYILCSAVSAVWTQVLSLYSLSQWLTAHCPVYWPGLVKLVSHQLTNWAPKHFYLWSGLVYLSWWSEILLEKWPRGESFSHQLLTSQASRTSLRWSLTLSRHQGVQIQHWNWKYLKHNEIMINDVLGIRRARSG